MNLGEGKKAAQFILQKDGTAKECSFAKPDATKTFKVNGVDFLTECKDTVCNAGIASTAVKREIVKENGDCETCADQLMTDSEDPKKCKEVVCEKAGWGPNKVAVCVNLQLETVNPLPEGVTKENIQAAQAELNTVLKEVAASMAALKASLTATMKLAFGLS